MSFLQLLNQIYVIKIKNNKQQTMITTRKLLIFMLLIGITACTSTNDPVNSSKKTSGIMTLTTTTSTYNGNFSPRHVLAIWVENNSGAFIKTLLVNAQARRQYLTNWYNSTSNGNTIDATTGATLNNHGVVTCSWSGTDVSGNLVNNGTYKVCMEFTENDGTGKFASFSFAKDTITNTQSPSAQSNFSNITIKWIPK
jgi:hypothetical protein